MLLPPQFMRSRNTIFLCTFLAAMLFAFVAEARHIKGGWIYYTYIGKAADGKLQYQVTVKVYRDCAPPDPGQNDTQINLSVFNTGNSSLYGNFTAPLSSQYPLNKTSYSECVNPKPEVCYVILEYSTTISLPASADGYTLSFQRCCRINGIVNVLQPSNSYGNTYSITIPGTTTGSTHPENSSPVFSQRDTLLVCYSSSMSLDYSAVDQDDDSLVYYFTNAYDGASQSNPSPATASTPPYGSLPYLSPYSPLDPFGTGAKINAHTGLITGISPSTTGEYVVAVGVDEYRDGKKIATTRKELHVNVANCSIAAAELPVRITSCDGFTVNFENLSSSPAIYSYYWDFGITGRNDDTSNLPVPTFTYPDTGVYKAKLVVNRTSSCSDSAFTEVRVFPGFFPGFKVDGSCYLNPFLFTDTTKAKYGTVDFWRWNFGDPAATGDTSRIKNPQYKYPGQGSYNVNLEVGSSKGCLDTVQVALTVTDKPYLFLPFKDTLICSIDSLPLIAVGNGIFSWSPTTNMINSNTANPTVFPKDTATYHVTLNENGCIATDSVKINVLDFITVDAGPDTTICRTDGLIMHPTTYGLSFRWQPAALFDNPNIKNPTATPTAALTTLYVTANLGKCQDRDSLKVRTVPYPVVNAGNDTVICFSTNATLHGQTVAGIHAWSPATLVSNAGNLITVSRPPGTTTYTLTVSDTLGCPKAVSDAVVVTVRPPVTIFAGNDTSVVYGQLLQFNAVSNGSIIKWTPATALSSSSVLNPTAVFKSGTLPGGVDQIRYVVSASTPEGCNNTDDIVVKVFKTPPSIFVPSGFTPNSDGNNDVIRPILAGMQRLEFFRIYNRYGQMVFETRQPGKGWDGNINGYPQTSAAFVYQCQAIDYQGNPVFAKGTFVLIR